MNAADCHPTHKPSQLCGLLVGSQTSSNPTGIGPMPWLLPAPPEFLTTYLSTRPPTLPPPSTNAPTSHLLNPMQLT